jgi:hypothetical protein
MEAFMSRLVKTSSREWLDSHFISQRVSAKFRLHLVLLILAGPVLFFGSSALAQTRGTGSIQGTVFDPSGAVLPNASVTAVDTATGYTVTQHTSGAGVYVLVSLPPATYTVSVNAAGFRPFVHSDVVVDALSIVGLDLHLEVGQSNQTVEVSSLPPQLHTDNGTLELTIPTTTYSSLPLTMDGGPKNALGFLSLMPGVVAGPILGNNLNGGPGQTSLIYISGMPLTTSALQGDTRDLNGATSTEVVNQFQVILSGVPAYYEGQGITNFILKSGTNQFHGDVYENIRNTVFDAAGFFSTSTPVEQQNEFGASLGGPILRNRLFFFFNYDGWRLNQGALPVLYSIPTAAEQSGNFSALPVPIYDPASTVCSASGVCTRTAFPGNIIPANRISPVSQSLQSYLPPTMNSSLQDNIANALTGGEQQNTFLGKVDLTVTKNNHLSFLQQYGHETQNGLSNSGGPQLPLPYTSSRFAALKIIVDQLGDTQTITQNLVNVFGFQFNRFETPVTNGTTGGDYPQKADLTGIPTGQSSSNFPPVSFTGPDSPTDWAISGNVQSFSEFASQYTYQDNLQWLRGKHSVTAGGQIIAQQDNESIPSALGNFSFSNSETAGLNPAGELNTTTGNAYASYLLGDVDSAGLTNTTVQETGARYRNYAVYIQDDWKVTPKFTLNLGLRYEIPKPFTEVQNRDSWLNPSLLNSAVSNFPGGLQFAGNGLDSCNCRTQVQTHYKTLGPRFGFAYSATNRTVVRGSFTIIHFNAGALGGNAQPQGVSLLGYSANPTPTSPNSGITPAFNWNNGFPSYTAPPFFESTLNTGYSTTTGDTGGTIAYNRPATAGESPYTMNWNLTLEQQVTPSTVWSLSYSANASRLIPIDGGFGTFSNQLNPKYLALGNLLTQPATPTTIAQAQAIVPGVGLPYPNFDGAIGQMLLPFPQYSGVTDASADFGNASYNSLQTYAQRTISQGLYFLASYTWSKEIDNSGGNAYLSSSSNPRTAYNLAINRAVGSVNTPQAVSVAYVYMLPFGRGHALGSGGGAFMNQFVGGWQLSGLNQYSSGAPLGAIGAACLVPYTGGCYANYNPNFHGSPRINGSYGSGNPKGSVATSYININAFENPASFTFGDTPRTAPADLYNPWSLNESVSLSKSFALREKLSLKLQADAFNLFNRVDFGGINTSITSSAFGTVSSQVNSPRNLQFEAYIKF